MFKNVNLRNKTKTKNHKQQTNKKQLSQAGYRSNQAQNRADEHL